VSEVVRRVVVTGAAGFVGSHLVHRLQRAGLPVVAIVRSPPTVDPAEGLEYVVRDLEQVDSLADLLRAGDVIVHLAARVHRMHDAANDAGAAYRSANLDVAQMLARSAAECGVRRVIFLSTAKVFGEGRERPYTINDPAAPADPYAQSKIDAEQVIRAVGDESGFEWTILRPPFVYGPGGKGNFPRLVALARVAQIVPLPLAAVDNKRSIVFVGNLVDAIVRCGLHPRANRRIVLPTDDHDVSTPELLRAIAAARSSRVRLFPCPPSLLRAAARLIGRSAEMDRLTESLRLDSHYLRDEFDWLPPFSLDRALAASVTRQDSNGSADAHD
jgi:nucleoside-diphosphate-sugar epimerase